MQTFLPYQSFAHSAQVLDNRRLGKQRVEALQILQTLIGERRGWSSHPAVQMWRGYHAALYRYMRAVCAEWQRRGFRNDRMSLHLTRLRHWDDPAVPAPPWTRNRRFHAAHRSNLLRKAPEHYRQFGWIEPPTLPYVWPTLKVGWTEPPTLKGDTNVEIG